jgi:hypothetical protein
VTEKAAPPSTPYDAKITSHGTELEYLLPVKVYMRHGKPTCAIDFGTNKVCRFYGSSACGTRERCMLLSVMLQRGDSTDGCAGMGLLVPDNKCPMWGHLYLQ